MATEKELRTVIGRILKDIRIDISDEFDQNFERQAFFTKAWARRRSPLRPGGHILVDTGALRKSISSRSDESSITFYSDLPYAAIHNEGGEIKVTARMKRYFWAKYNEAQGGFGRKKNGELRNNKKNRQLGTEAEFWKAMALMKEGKVIKIPKRQFLGMSPEVEEDVRRIIEDNLTSYFENDFKFK
ncbi:phage virion morphogenesis protein [Segatella copri]|jgi:phage gpG-like protein|uniref:Phage virion morphogenesis protein n=1 Tax=Segatella copri TaxID=165179 RepID=A0AAW5I186_9BACT|nr:phage virion morphogenesis protein [Segatella copri]MCF0067084.1 phage virion morphogenesis protein [Segatella copri]MCP9456921.1 phage virion morphogenesis protein [Segatella copri]MCP9501273.1 phage virion morphogenesis protein [Segatella copri]MCP9504052.1 phage virion morphogenesis protein [Segatella copri]MCP9507019.1 phage virion morphogenesis protein [Segatella copri]